MEFRHGGFWLRLVAAIIDGIILQVGLFIVGLIVGIFVGIFMGVAGASTEDIQWVSMSIGYGIGIIGQWLYFTIFEISGWQATPGKKVLSLKVTDMEGQQIGFGQANIRYWSKIISALILFIGFIMIAFTEKKQGLHDIFAKTLVIKDKPA
ncbi:RDD family protein [Idiomarina sp. HP20-50]|uniref:RDD family protein n=1 Tax=Idiomarina sp. HP20-50 TaxID=3070813 RepID=UPI00294B7ED2|nr:RDD family protein [Idiomarina sp. HP20-50]MDV6316147.1 RDD family protein [Idiomarina sp. HP20-50]